LNAPFNSKIESTGEFLSFLLNDRNFAPITFDMTISFDGKEPGETIKLPDFSSDEIISFSGGFDSSATVLMSLDKKRTPHLLWIGFGQKNEETEDGVATKMASVLNQPLDKVHIDLGDYIEKGWNTSWSYIIPGRNFLFVSIAASLLHASSASEGVISMGVHEEEIKNVNPGPDKSPRFFEECTKRFSDYYGKSITLRSPLQDVTKTELAAHWKNVWVDRYGITPHQTSSCYYGTNCGTCNACFKRAVSFLAAGVGLDSDIQVHPFAADPERTLKYLERCIKDFTDKRKYETLLAFKRAYRDLPTNVQQLFDTLTEEDLKLIDEKEQFLDTFVMEEYA
jgi:7-cyano-7-deazaguanine synthase in queuosine biosynthesis